MKEQKKNIRDSRIMVLFIFTAAAAALAVGMTVHSSRAEAKSAGILEKAKSLVDLNNADEKTLQTLPGINKSTAKAIIAGRPYKNIGDLKRIPGMTDKVISAIKNKVSFGAPAAKAASPSIPSAAGILDKASQQTKP